MGHLHLKMAYDSCFSIRVCILQALDFFLQMPVVNSRNDVAADAETVASFFTETCAVGTSGDGPANGGQPWDQLCSACGVSVECITVETAL